MSLTVTVALEFVSKEVNKSRRWRCVVQVAQCRTVLEAVHRAAGGGPCILAGDFNSHPGSAVHRFCRNGTLLLAGEDRRCMSGQKALGGSPARVRPLQHPHPPSPV